MAFLLVILLHFAHGQVDSVCNNDSQFRMGDFLGGGDKGYTAPEIQRCMNHFDGSLEKPKPGDDPEKCVQDCSTQSGRSKCMKAILEKLVISCKRSGYKCGQKGACRVGVDNLLACKRKGGDCSFETQNCTANCTPEPGNNCIEEDIEDFRHGRNICATGAPAKALISDNEVQQIIDTRAQEIAVQRSAPQSEMAKTSIFYGDTPPGGNNNGGKTNGSEDSDLKGNGGAETADTGDKGSASNSNGGNGSGSGSGGEMMSGLSGGSSGGASSGGSSSGGLNFPDFAGGTSGGASSGSFNASGNGASGVSTDAIGGAGGKSSELEGESFNGAPAPRNFGGSRSGSGSSSGGAIASPFAGGGGGPNPQGALRTASASKAGAAVGGRGAGLESSSFQSGFHKGQGTEKKGKSTLAAAKAKSVKGRTRGKKGDGSMNLAKLFSKGLSRGVAQKEGPSGRSLYSADVGRGTHPVFRSINSFYDTVPLDMNGNIDTGADN